MREEVRPYIEAIVVIVVGLDLLLDVLVISNEDGKGLRETDIGGNGIDVDGTTDVEGGDDD